MQETDSSRVVREINLMQEGPDRTIIYRISMALFVLAFVCFVILLELCPHGPFPWIGCAAVAIVVYLLSVPVHELLHAAAFLVLGPSGTKVHFGFASGLAFASSPGTRMSKGRFGAVLLVPSIVLTCVFVALAIILEAWALPWVVVLGLLQLSGAAGDIYMNAVIARTHDADVCEDTKDGMLLLARA